MLTNGRGQGGNRKADFAALDKLPREVREAIADGPESYNSEAILREVRRYQLDEREAVLTVGDIMREVTRQAAIRNYGRHHPQAADDCRWPINPRPKRLRKI